MVDEAPPIQYARTTDGVRIAYSVWGGGDGLPVFHLAPIPGSALVEGRMSAPARFTAVDRPSVVYVRRGMGSSQRGVDDLSLEALALDIDAVADACGFERIALWSRSSASLTAIQFAATRPNRCAGLVMGTPTATGEWSSRLMLAIMKLNVDWEWAANGLALAIFGTIAQAATALAGAPDAFQRSHHPDDLRRQLEIIVAADVRPMLPQVTVPTIIGLSDLAAVQRRVEGVHDVAAGIPGALVVTGDWGVHGGTEPRALEFLGGLDSSAAIPPQPAPGIRASESGAFRAILFTDLASHTEMMDRLGDDAGRDVLREHERITRRALSEHGGTEVKTLGDGFMASFGSVSQSLRCAQALQHAFESPLESGYRLNVRIGVNAGEPISEEDDLFGTSVIVAARTAASAGGGQIVVTDVVRQLVAGKEFLFADRGLSTLKGFEDPVHTWEVLW